MKILIKILATALLSYAILMLLLDGLFAFLSLSPQTNIWVLIEESLIPFPSALFLCYIALFVFGCTLSILANKDKLNFLVSIYV